MTDREYRDTALLNYVLTLLDVPMNYPEEEILRMYLEKKISVELIVDDVRCRFDRIMKEKINEKLQ